MDFSEKKFSQKLAIGVLGPGGLGGFLAAVLSRSANEVTCIGRPATVEVINASGLRLESPQFGDFTARPSASEKLETPVDILFITTKAHGLESALQRIEPADLGKTTIVPLLNGIEHISFLRERLKATIIAGSMRISSRIVQPGHIIQHSNFSVINIASNHGDARHTSQVAEVLRSSGVDCQVHASEQEVLWGKLVRLNALACTTTITNEPIGWIREHHEWRHVLEAIVREGSRVAGHEGVIIDPRSEMEMIDTLPESLTSSMRDDTYAGRSTELDAIAGAVVRIGKKYQVKCPVTEDIMNRIMKKSLWENHSQ